MTKTRTRTTKKTPPPAGLVALFRMLDDGGCTRRDAQDEAAGYAEAYARLGNGAQRDDLIEELAGEPDPDGSPEVQADEHEASMINAAYWLGVVSCWHMLREITGGAR